MNKFIKLLNKKSFRWTSGGAACLVAAALLFAGGQEVGVKAESLQLANNVFELDSAGERSYYIKTASELIALGNATAKQTEDITFILKNDLSDSEAVKITSPAKGDFAGTFDGNGHIVTLIEAGNSENGLTSSGNDSVSEGLLFGTVSGTVENLIIEIPQDVMYTRTSSVGRSEEKTEKTEVTSEATAPYSGTESFSSFSTDDDAKTLADEFNSRDDQNENIITPAGSDKTYYRVSKQEEFRKTITYELNDANTDQFGIVCGTLEENASIDRVYVKGNGSLIVKQFADKVSNTDTQAGKRDKYFYYEKGTGANETTETSDLTGEASAENIMIYDESQKVSNSQSDNNMVELSVEAPKYVAYDGELIYKVSVFNNQGFNIQLKSISWTDSEQIGTWRNETNTSDVNWENENLAPGVTGNYLYVVSGVQGEAAASFILDYFYMVEVESEEPVEPTDEDSIETEWKEIEGSVTTALNENVKVLDTTLEGTEQVSGTDLQVSITPSKVNYLASGAVDVEYTLKISNNIALSAGESNPVATVKAADIYFEFNNQPQSVQWMNNNDETFAEEQLEMGESLTLTGTVAFDDFTDQTSYQGNVSVTVSVSKNISEDIITYKYVESVPESLESYGTETLDNVIPGEASITAGNHLNAGIIAGTSKGSITSVKQDMIINGTSYNENTAQLNVGGIAGAAVQGASASNLYILGTDNYAGVSSVLPEGSVLGTGTNPGGEAWAEFDRYNQSSLFDLAWLVKEDTETKPIFSFAQPVNGEVTIGIEDSKLMTERDLEYTVAYNARKSMEDNSQENIYEAEKIVLGDSGFYRLINVYATDGYYHYTKPVTELDSAEFVYPYDSSAPYEIDTDESKTCIVRTENPLEDKVQITLKNGAGHVNGLSGTIYYEVNTTVIPTSESEELVMADGVVKLPLDIIPSVYEITPVIDNRIYPTLISKSFEDREALPQPLITCFDYYNANGAKNDYVDFAIDASYEVGSDMLIIPNDDADKIVEYPLRYKFSDQLLEEGSWDKQLYTGTSDIMSDAAAYVDSAVIPESLAGKNAYLYVEVSKKGYEPSVYCYGPFNAIEKAELSAYLNGDFVGELDENHRVLNNDIVTFEANVTDYTGVQYAVSSIPTISYNWKDYENKITLFENQGGYIYARIKYAENKFSEPQLFDFNFGTACAAPIITPNTGLGSSGTGAAATIEPTILIAFSSRTSNASIFYVKSDESETIDMERVTAAPSETPEDGIVDGYKYFEVDHRWYRTRNTEVEAYKGGFTLNHMDDSPKYMYISAVAIAPDYDMSEELEYVYKVQPPQQVKSPEAAFETRYTPGGETIETSTVSLGSKLSFFSVTPGATLYYSVGSETEEITEQIPEDGVTVEGNYGGNFVVRVQAKKENMTESEIITFIYKIADKEMTNAPTATPGTNADIPTVVIPGNKILLSTTTNGAYIFYTTDGSDPEIIENEDGTFTSKNEEVTKLYNSSEGIVMPIDGSEQFTITAIAVKAGLNKSAEVRFTYAYPDAVLAPYANIDSGKVELNTQILLKNLTDGAVIYYNAAYGAAAKAEDVEEPTLSSTVFSEEYPFTITQKTIIKAMAAKDGVKSSVVTFTYDPLAKLDAPKASIETGSVVSNGTVLELIAAKDAVIYYTMDGSDPTDPANTAVISGNSIILSGEPGGQVTIKAYAKSADNSQSDVVTFTYQFSQNAMSGVTANIETGSTVKPGTKIILMSDVTGADIYYTTNGDSPIDRGIKGTTVEVNGTPGSSFTIKAVAKVNGEAGIVSTFIYKIKDKPDAPTASPSGGTLTVATRVSLHSSEAEIYYTIDGTDPTKSSNVYGEPILINRTTTLKAIAVSEEGEVSDVATFYYTAAPKAGMPKADKEDGQVLEPGTKVSLSSDTKNAVIYYTTDGTDPKLDNLEDILVYDSEGIEINRSVTVKAVAYADGMQLSNISTWSYIVETIPAVEIKKKEAAKQAEDELRDTDASALDRKNAEEEETEGLKRVLRESKYNTMVFAARENVEDNAVLQAEMNEINQMAVRNAKTLFGNDYTILSEYNVRLKSGKNYVQPKGEVEVVLPIPEGYEHAKLSVVSIDKKDKLTTLETRRDEENLYVSTAVLNDIAIVGLENMQEDSSHFPYLTILEAIAGAVMLFGVIYYIKEKIKKRK